MRNLISKHNSYDYEVMVYNRWNNRMEMDKKFKTNSGAGKMQTRIDKVWSKKEVVSRPVCGKSQPEPNQLGSNLTLPVITESEEDINKGLCMAIHSGQNWQKNHGQMRIEKKMQHCQIHSQMTMEKCNRVKFILK